MSHLVSSIFAPPRTITDIADCYFYHVMDIPGHGRVGAEWDLRGREEAYFGGPAVNFRGKRVLEIGTASGHLCRYMESRGANVVGFDLSADHSWDVVPFTQYDVDAVRPTMRDTIERMKNGWWFCRALFKSKARAVYGSVYDIPEEIGPVDVATFGAVLLHLQNPFLALQNALRLTRETAIVTDLYYSAQPRNFFSWGPSWVTDWLDRPATHARSWLDAILQRMKMKTPGEVAEAAAREVLAGAAQLPVMTFLPNARVANPDHSFTWWYLSPRAIVEMLAVLGFEKTVVSYHRQKHGAPGRSSEYDWYTVVGTRTRGGPER